MIPPYTAMYKAELTDGGTSFSIQMYTVLMTKVKSFKPDQVTS